MQQNRNLIAFQLKTTDIYITSRSILLLMYFPHIHGNISNHIFTNINSSGHDRWALPERATTLISVSLDI